MRLSGAHASASGVKHTIDNLTARSSTARNGTVTYETRHRIIMEATSSRFAEYRIQRAIRRARRARHQSHTIRRI